MAEPSPAPSPRPTIIQVDDSIFHATLTAKALREIVPSINVINFNSGAQAVAHLGDCGGRWTMPEVLILTMRAVGGMADSVDGFEVLRAVRGLPRCLNLAVLIASRNNEEEDVFRAADLGAGFIVKPAEQTAYDDYAAQIERYRQLAVEQLLVRRFCGAGGELDLPTLGALAQSGATMTTAAASLSPLPGQSIRTILAGALAYFGGSQDASGEGLFVDRKLAELTRACREEGIDEIDVLTPSKDSVIVQKRRRVIYRLMDAEWSNREIMRRVPVKDRYLDEARAEWNRRQQRKDSAALVQPQTLKRLG